jgi:DNA-binding transcriptional MerR regulator
MPNIYGKYSLTEIAHELKVTPAFINRIQRETGIGGQIGIKGQPSLFNENDIHIFRRIKILRRIDCSFSDIKEIWDLENKIIELYKQFVNQKMEIEGKATSFIIHSGTLYVPKPLGQIKGNKKSRAYYEWVSELGKIAKRIKELFDSFAEEAEEVRLAVRDLIPPGWDDILKIIENLEAIHQISQDK